MTHTPTTLSRVIEQKKESIVKKLNSYGGDKFGVNTEIKQDALFRLLKDYKETTRKEETKIAVTKLLTQTKPTTVNGKAKEPKAPAKPEIVKWKWPDVTEFDFINFIEMGLVIVGLFRLYGLPGLLLSCMVCLFLWKSQKIAKDKSLRDANRNAINIVGWLCAAIFPLHFITFISVIPDVDLFHPVVQRGVTIEDQYEWIDQLLKGLGAFIPALFVSVLSFNAILTTNKIAKQQ